MRTDAKKGKIHIDTWADGKSGTRVEFYSIEQGSHAWPSGRRISATPLIWKFFAEHARGKPDQESSAKPGATKKKRSTGQRKKAVVR